MIKKRLLLIFLLIPLLCLAGLTLYHLPPLHERLAWRLESLRTQVRYALNPPDQAVFVPQQGLDQLVQTSLPELAPSSAPSALHTPTPTLLPPTPTWPGPTATWLPSPTATPTATPLPASIYLSGIRHEWQSFNNCGPTNLAMALSFWGWTGDQRDTRAYLRPHPDDYNVLPEEMLAFVETQTGLEALLRVAGDLDLLKRLLAAGFPLIIEMGHHPSDDWWMGHYLVLNGYDDAWGRFISQDSLVMADFPLPYEDLQQGWWRDFNYLYLVIYPPERESQLLTLLGPHADPHYNNQHALQLAEAELQVLQGRDLFFAWYNKGSSLVNLGQFGPAAEAYDQAFTLYQALPEKQRPWRIGWYQSGPYQAYFHTGRYQDVIQLADTTLNVFAKPPLEESLYWRGLARAATGDLDGAISDFKLAVDLNLTFAYGQAELEQLGVIYP
jgi:hypothetical protein